VGPPRIATMAVEAVEAEDMEIAMIGMVVMAVATTAVITAVVATTTSSPPTQAPEVPLLQPRLVLLVREATTLRNMLNTMAVKIPTPLTEDTKTMSRCTTSTTSSKEETIRHQPPGLPVV
jgi:hypothetical protein